MLCYLISHQVDFTRSIAADLLQSSVLFLQTIDFTKHRRQVERFHSQLLLHNTRNGTSIRGELRGALALVPSGVVAGAEKGVIAPPPKFKLSENVLLVGDLSSKNAKYGVENPPFVGNSGAKIEIFSTDNVICRKCAAVC